MNEYHNDFAVQQALDNDMDDFTRAYILAAYWTDTGETSQGQPEGDELLSAECIQKIKQECADFQSKARELLALAYTDKYTAESAGHDFWLTRNGHGVGFWDRGLGELGDRLSKVAEGYGARHLLPGNDEGQIFYE